MNDFPKLGICTAGMEPLFFKTLQERSDSVTTGYLVYVELGFAGGETFLPVCEWLRKHLGEKFVAVGVDIEKGWSLERSKIELIPNNAHVSLDGSVAYLNSCRDESIDVLFIDGCHGAPCAESDFLAGAPKVKPDGFVIFHDTSEAAQGTSFPQHCGNGIGVRDALRALGLIEGNRTDWSFYGEVPCVPSGPEAGSGGIMVFKKTA